MSSSASTIKSKSSSANKKLFQSVFMRKSPSPKRASPPKRRSTRKATVKSVKNIDNLTFKNGSHEALAMGGFRVSKEATEELSKIALHDNARALEVAKNARKISSLEGKKTVLLRHIQSANLPC